VNDLRWLICKGLVEHACELTLEGEHQRSFRPLGKLGLTARTCGVLTNSGADLMRRLAPADVRSGGHQRENGHALNGAATVLPLLSRELPVWDQDRAELLFGGVVIKRFKVQAPNQEVILTAFQEEGWPARIDDPLPPHPDQDSKRRLHDTINSLNRNQKQPLLRFMGDGSGLGVRWERLRS
jgi:hypothetical protein